MPSPKMYYFGGRGASSLCHFIILIRTKAPTISLLFSFSVFQCCILRVSLTQFYKYIQSVNFSLEVVVVVTAVVVLMSNLTTFAH